MARKIISEEIKEQARQLKGEGRSPNEIAATLGISRSAAYEILKGEAEPGVGEGFPEKENAFKNLLERYQIKNAEVITDFVTSLSPVILEDPEALFAALSDCELSPTKRRVITRHWASTQNLPMPSLEPIEGTPALQGKPRRFIVAGGQALPDADGPYTFGEALAVIEAQGRKGNEPENPAIVDLRNKLSVVEKELADREREKYQDQLGRLSAEISSMKTELARSAELARSGNEYSIMGRGLDIINQRLGAAESLALEYLSRLPQATGEPRLTPPLGESVLRRTEAEERTLDALANRLFYSGRSVRPKETPPPPPPLTYE